MKIPPIRVAAQLTAFRQSCEQIVNLDDIDSIHEFLGSVNGVGDNYDRLMHTFDREYGLSLTEVELKEALPIIYKSLCKLNLLLDSKMGRHDFAREKCGAIKLTLSPSLIQWQLDGYNPDKKLFFIRDFETRFLNAIEEVVSLSNNDFWLAVTERFPNKPRGSQTNNDYVSAIGNLISDFACPKS